MMFWFYIILFSISVISILITVYYSIKISDAKFAVFAITLIGILSIAQWNVIDYIKSQPLEIYVDDFVVMAYEEARPHIYIWGYMEGRQYPVTLMIPWTQETMQELSGSDEEISEGRIAIRWTHEGGPEIYDFIEHNPLVKE